VEKGERDREGGREREREREGEHEYSVVSYRTREAHTRRKGN